MFSGGSKKIAKQLLDKGMLQTGSYLLLGDSDTGKTTLAKQLIEAAAANKAVALVDADTGQSHLGPPTTVARAIITNPQFQLSKLTAEQIYFVGSVSPVGHLLQLTSAVLRCVQDAAREAELIIIDTPGLVRGPAACVLWWTLQQLLHPELILAVQKSGELTEVLSGLKHLQSRIEYIEASPAVELKSMQQRQEYRQKQLEKYFRKSRNYKIKTNEIAIQNTRYSDPESLISRVVGLRDEYGVDRAIGLITDLRDENNMIIKAPEIDISRIKCMIVGDITLELPDDDL